MLISPFPPSLAQRFESGLIGLALGCLANQSLTPGSIDRYWEMLHRNIDQVSHLDRPLVAPTAPVTPEEAEWSVLAALPWLWVLLEDEAGQQIWLAQQPDPLRALLLQSFTQLSHAQLSHAQLSHGFSDGFSRHGFSRHRFSNGFSDGFGNRFGDRFGDRFSHPLSPILSPFPAAQAVWDQAVHLTENAVSLAEGLKQWQTTLGHLPPDLNAIGIALWLTWRSDHLILTLALAQQISPVSPDLSPDRFNPDQTIAPFDSPLYSPHLLCFAGLFGGFAWPPESYSAGSYTPGSPVLDLRDKPNVSVLRQYSDRLFRAWAGRA